MSKIQPEVIFLTRAGMVPLLILSLVFAGCGPSAEVLEKQEQDTAKAFKQASENPPNLPPEIQERRKYRMEMDFGVTPDLVPTGTQGTNK